MITIFSSSQNSSGCKQSEIPEKKYTSPLPHFHPAEHNKQRAARQSPKTVASVGEIQFLAYTRKRGCLLRAASSKNVDASGSKYVRIVKSECGRYVRERVSQAGKRNSSAKAAEVILPCLSEHSSFR